MKARVDMPPTPPLRPRFLHNFRARESFNGARLIESQKIALALEQVKPWYDGNYMSKSNGVTICFLESNRTTVAVGYAFCSLHDQFSKAIGRRISLNRAWRAYLLTSGPNGPDYGENFPKVDIEDAFFFPPSH
jgi:hypothetical protein